MKLRTYLDIPVEQVLDNAKHLEMVIVIGYDKEGPYYASSTGNAGEILMALEKAKVYIIENAEQRD